MAARRELGLKGVWKEITSAANIIGVDNRSPADGYVFHLYIRDIYHV